MNVIRSVYEEQDDILRGIIALHCPDGFDCDVTYGSGKFWKNIPAPRLKFDIDPQIPGVQKACSTLLPLNHGAVGSIVFDPPFLTYIRAGREGNGKMALARRFSGYWTYQDLEDHYRDTISEAHRVLRAGGILVVKCQDIVHNHRLHATHVNVVNMADIEGFRLRDLFVLPARHRMPSPNRRGAQKHARVFHSYFLVLEKVGRKPRRARVASPAQPKVDAAVVVQ